MSSASTPLQPTGPMSLRALGLRPGMAIQTRRLVEGTGKKESQFIGAIENKGVMVGPQGPDGERTGLEPGDVCIVRGFTGQYEFSFVSKTLQVFDRPFVYALLAYPTNIDVRTVRQSMRTPTSWPAAVKSVDKDGVPSGETINGSVVDISLQGAMIYVAAGLGIAGDMVGIQIDTMIEGVRTRLTLSAMICHRNKSRTDENYYVGLSFRSLSQQDKLMLHYLTKAPKPE